MKIFEAADVFQCLNAKIYAIQLLTAMCNVVYITN